MRKGASPGIETPLAAGVNVADAMKSFGRHLRAQNLSPRTIQTTTRACGSSRGSLS
jgi:hypothetical protein